MHALTEDTLHDAVRLVCGIDPDLDGLVQQFGPPPLWAREPGFGTMVQIILEQQVSLASAAAVFDRLVDALGDVTTARLAGMPADELRSFGFTRQKASYCHGLAWEIERGAFDLDGLSALTDEEAHRALLSLRGIGPWTASIYQLMALRRPDIWPDGDLALAETTRRIKAMSVRPDKTTLRSIADAWRPWRSVAARILWHAYLSDKQSVP